MPGACGRAARRGRCRRRRGRRRTRSRPGRGRRSARPASSISSTSPSVRMNVSVPWFERLGESARAAPCGGTRRGRARSTSAAPARARSSALPAPRGRARARRRCGCRARSRPSLNRLSTVRCTSASLPGTARRREDHGVALDDLHVLVVLVRHARERRRRLALAARRDDRELLVRDVRQLADAHQHAFRRVQVAALDRHVDVVDHAAAGDEDAPAGALGRVEHLLHAGDERRERRDDDAALGLAP